MDCKRRPGILSRLTKRCVPAFLLLIFLTSCSTMKIAYNTANWWFGWVLDDIVPISWNKDQKKQIKSQFRELHKWHRDTQLSLYADFITQINDDLESKNLTIELYEKREQDAEALIDNVVFQLIPFLADIIASLSDKQAEELLQGTGFKTKDTPPIKENNTARNPQPQQDKEKQRQRSIELREKRILKTTKKWLGSVSDSQKQMIAKWSSELPLEEDYIDPQWQKEQKDEYQQNKLKFIHMMENQRQQTEVVLDYLHNTWSRGNVTVNIEGERQLKIDIVNSVSEKQQRHLQKKLTKLAKSLRSLSGS